jgi:RNA polymerase sporulation-specific sigma factor
LENILSDTESEESMVEKISLRQGIEKLPQREATVIKLRYYHGLTQERVAKVLDVSQVQVSRIEKKALAEDPLKGRCGNVTHGSGGKGHHKRL